MLDTCSLLHTFFYFVNLVLGFELNVLSFAEFQPQMFLSFHFGDVFLKVSFCVGRDCGKLVPKVGWTFILRSVGD